MGVILYLEEKWKEDNFELINLPDGSNYGVDYYTGNKENEFSKVR